MIWILVMLISSVLQTEAKHDDQCYADIKSPYTHFAWLTSYVSSRGSQMVAPKECRPIYVWGLIRHGTRYPAHGNKYVKLLPHLRDEILRNHKHGRGSLCKKDLENLKNWCIDLNSELNLELTSQGIEDLLLIAKKIKEVFPTLFKSQSKDLFVFQTSNTNRTRDSAVTFSNELLGTDFKTIKGNNIIEDDVFLQLNKHCPVYQKLVKDSAFQQEINSFESSSLWKKMVKKISNRLGFRKSLSHDSIMLMYRMCAYENAWFVNTRQPFCAAFTSEELKLIEYNLDLTLYHTTGYGNAYPNEKMACPIVRDMMLSLNNAAKTNAEPCKHKGKFLFSHSESIVPTTVKLGLQKDEEPLTLENYKKMVDNRKWKSALFDSFAANIIAALFKCPYQNDFQHVVTFYQNERPVKIPQCTSSPCTLKELQHVFEDVFEENQCSTDFCEIPKIVETTPKYPSKSSSAHSFRFGLAAVIIYFSFINNTELY